MKKYLLVFLLIMFIVPSVALASWWNPFSWFSNWTFPKAEEKTQVLENRIAELEEKLNNASISATAIEAQNDIIPVAEEADDVPTTSVNTTISKPTQSPTPTPPPPVVDTCLNIEGIQLQVPSGYNSVLGICSLVNMTDMCPNIIGVQSTIPVGLYFYKNTSECLTDSQIDAAEEEMANELKKETQCQGAKERKVDINQEISEINQEYSQLISDAQQNPNGMWGGAVEQQIAQLSNLQLSETNPLYDELLVVESEIGLYCY